MPEPIDKERLKRQFDKWWPELETKLQSIKRIGILPQKPERTERDLLEEVLTLLRVRHIHMQPIIIKQEPDVTFIKNQSDSDRNQLDAKHLINLFYRRRHY